MGFGAADSTMQVSNESTALRSSLSSRVDCRQ